MSEVVRVNPDPKVHPDQQAHPDKLDNVETPDQLELMVQLDRRDNVDQLDKPDHVVNRENVEYPVKLVSNSVWESTVTVTVLLIVAVIASNNKLM